jgi:hypothetical protein
MLDEIEKAPSAEGAFSEKSSAGCFGNSENSPPRPNTQIKFQNPAVVSSPRPRRIDVRISAADGRSPIGRTRPLKLIEPDIERLVDFALRLEARQ